MFTPEYTITSKVLLNIVDITKVTVELNLEKFSPALLRGLAKTAKEVSSYSSTSIEGNPLPLTKVKRLLKSTPKKVGDNEREVLNYNKALLLLTEKTESREDLHLDSKLIMKIQKIVTDGLLDKHHSGKFREEHVVVHDPQTGDIVYLSPDYKDVPKLMRNLVAFINRSHGEIHPVLRAALFHKAFVIIHPFSDGNGRTARLITTLLLADMDVNIFNIFSFERYYNQDVPQYFLTVGEYGDYHELVDQIDYTAWLEYFTEGVVDELLRVKKDVEKEASELTPPLKKYEKQIIDFIAKSSQMKDSDYATLTTRSKTTRARDFKKLVTRGLIQRQGKGKSSFYVMKRNK